MSVLFADLVGFTSLSEQLDAEDVTLVQDAYFDAVRETVARHGGQLEKFVGDAAMAVFGAPRVRDDDAERAVRAGLSLVAAVQRVGAGLGLAPGALRLRVGVASGETVYGEASAERGPVTGDVVNVAARLQAAGEPETVTIGEATALAVADAIQLERLPPLELKGKSEPVPAWRVTGVFAERSRERALGGLQAPTLGRADEVTRLRALVGETARVVVVAPPGVGKTRLLDELAAAASDAAVLRARLRPDVLSPFEPVAQLAGGTREPAELSALVRRGRRERGARGRRWRAPGSRRLCRGSSRCRARAALLGLARRARRRRRRTRRGLAGRGRPLGLAGSARIPRARRRIDEELRPPRRCKRAAGAARRAAGVGEGRRAGRPASPSASRDRAARARARRRRVAACTRGTHRGAVGRKPALRRGAAADVGGRRDPRGRAERVAAGRGRGRGGFAADGAGDLRRAARRPAGARARGGQESRGRRAPLPARGACRARGRGARGGARDARCVVRSSPTPIRTCCSGRATRTATRSSATPATRASRVRSGRVCTCSSRTGSPPGPSRHARRSRRSSAGTSPPRSTPPRLSRARSAASVATRSGRARPNGSRLRPGSPSASPPGRAPAISPRARSS